MSLDKSILSFAISAKNKIIIKPVEDDLEARDFDPQARIFAINWFNLRSPFFYHLYSLLAIKFVRRVFGKVHFKGKLMTQLEGERHHQRENLLIVTYPTPVHFLKLLSFKFFQVISLFRILAVKQFCFGFTENLLRWPSIDGNNVNGFNQHQIYLVHHFQGNKQWLRENYQQLVTTAEQQQMGSYFYGLTTARLVQEKAGQQQVAHFFIDGILLFSADSKQQIEDFITTDCYQTFKNSNNTNDLYLFSRTV